MLQLSLRACQLSTLTEFQGGERGMKQTGDWWDLVGMAENISNFNLLGLYWQRNHKLLKAYFIHIFFGQRKFHHCQVKMLPLFLSLLLTYKIFWKDLIRIRKQLIQPEPVMETRCLVAGSCLVFFFFFCYFSVFAIDREVQPFGAGECLSYWSPFTTGKGKMSTVCLFLPIWMLLTFEVSKRINAILWCLE